MPARLRPVAPIAPRAVLVGDPGRSLLLAQELLEAPKMSNHARGLWGYFGTTPDGRELTVQATGMGGPSAAIVLSDLAEAGVRRAVRVGTATALEPSLDAGETILVGEAHAWGGPGREEGRAVLPDAELSAALGSELGIRARPGSVASLDVLATEIGPEAGAELGADAVDMQTAALFGRGRDLGVAVAALLIVVETAAGERLPDEALETEAKLAGRAAAAVL